MNKCKSEKELYDGYCTQEQRDAAMLRAALERKPSYFGKMNKEQKEEYNKLVEWLKTLPPGATVDIPYDFD